MTRAITPVVMTARGRPKLSFVPPSNEGARNAGCASASAAPCAKGKKHTSVVATVAPEASGVPHAVVLRLASCSPRERPLGCHRRLRGTFLLRSEVKRPDVSTLCIGQAASMGSFLLAAGKKGKRFSLPNSRIMVHQPSAGFQGQATDIEIHANEVMDLKKRLNEIYSKHTGKSVDDVKKALERDNFMKPDTAKEFGLIDAVVENRS